MSGKKKGGNANQPKGGDPNFKFDLGGSGKPELTKETQAALMPVLQGRLDKLIGKDSGYLETLPQPVQQRIKALKKLQSRHDELQDEFEKEMAALEKKYNGLKDPLYTRRSEIVTGASEPTAEELVDDKSEEKKDVKVAEVKPEDKDIKGIPEFWMLVFKHHYELEAMVHPIDEPLMKHITDVKLTFPRASENDSETFALEFHFSDNEFIEDKVVTKTYLMETESGSTILEKIETSGIKWKSGKNITVKMVAQKQGGRGGRRGRGGKSGGPPKMVPQPVDSFFHFFDNVDDLETDDPEEENDLLEQEYELGMIIRTQIIQDAVKWFTGEVPMMDDEDDEELEDGEEDEDDDDEEMVPAKKGKGAKKTTADRLNEEYNSSDDEDFDPKKDAAAAAASGQAQPECKQQ